MRKFVFVALLAALGCGGGSGSGYDGLWTMDYSEGLCGTNGARWHSDVTVADGAFTFSGKSTTVCPDFPLDATIAGSIDSNGLVSGNVNVVSGGNPITVAGKCDTPSSCRATGSSAAVLVLTKK